MDLFPSRVRILALLAIVALTSVGCERGGKFWTGLWSPGDSVDNVGYKPEQVLPFSHKLHAGDMKMDCQYCHSGARRSAAAGVPPMNTCMGCHKFAKTDAESIKLLTSQYEKNEALEWTKVHDLPDFVRFSHKPHILKFMPKGEENPESSEVCAKCHGEVKEMTVAQQAAPLQMGWCVDCHINNEAPISCNTCHF